MPRSPTDLTEAFVRTATSDGKPDRLIADSRQANLYFRVLMSGRKSCQLRARVGDRWVVETLGPWGVGTTKARTASTYGSPAYWLQAVGGVAPGVAGRPAFGSAKVRPWVRRQLRSNLPVGQLCAVAEQIFTAMQVQSTCASWRRKRLCPGVY
jgi:hypothetical protein